MLLPAGSLRSVEDFPSQGKASEKKLGRTHRASPHDQILKGERERLVRQWARPPVEKFIIGQGGRGEGKKGDSAGRIRGIAEGICKGMHEGDGSGISRRSHVGVGDRAEGMALARGGTCGGALPFEEGKGKAVWLWVEPGVGRSPPSMCADGRAASGPAIRCGRFQVVGRWRRRAYLKHTLGPGDISDLSPSRELALGFSCSPVEAKGRDGRGAGQRRSPSRRT